MKPSDKVDFFSLSPDELARVLGGSGRARQAWQVARAGLNPIEDASLSSKVRTRLAHRCRMQPARVEQRQCAEDQTTKLLVRLRDGEAVETVVIPSPKRTTVCLSTQVGCSRSCIFCESGRQGLTRNLSPAEIVYQINLANRELASQNRPPISNVVLMGMGEPLDNFPAVQKAIEIMLHPHGWRLAKRRLTLSTVGPSPRAILETQGLPGSLAWSLHSCDDEIRRRLIPGARHEVAALRDAFAQVIRGTKAHLFIEMALVDGLNDRASDMEDLMHFLDALKDQVRLNLLPLNPGPSDLRASPAQRVAARKKQLQNNGFFCEARRPRGLDIQAACGQLASR